jgi:hypothetical protein
MVAPAIAFRLSTPLLTINVTAFAIEPSFSTLTLSLAITCSCVFY